MGLFVGMATSPATTVLQFLRRLLTVRTADALSDGDLINRFAQDLDEDAFAELLRRHGPMVLGVCRRVLGDSADAEDAFQATFLVLVRKARGLRRPASVANWLHGVAHRTALKARSAAVKRRQREREAAAMSATSTADDLAWRDLGPVLDEEIRHLPARYRDPFVLCHLEGKTNEEAARQLGCPKGTVLSRLSRARERLRVRLTKRGITLSTAALAALVTGPAVSASVPAMLAQATLQSAAAFTAGGIVAAPVLTLTEGVLHAMFAVKAKIAIAIVLGVTLLAGAGTYGYGRLNAGSAGSNDLPQAEAKKPAQTPQAEKSNPPEANKKIMDLMQKRLDAIKEQWKARAEELLAGKTTVDVLLSASARITKAQQEMTDRPADHLRILETQFERMKLAQEVLEARFLAGKVSTGEVSEARFYRYDAEIALERFKAKLPKEGVKGEVTKSLFEGIEVDKQP
jgi:RNA polymerase sigma factor (sigma-70 family)